MNSEVWVFDLEGTLTTGETWKGIARWLRLAGRGKAYRSFFNAHLPGALLAKAGLINKRNYQNKWMRDLARLLAGFSCADLEEMSAWVLEHELWTQRRSDVLRELRQGLADGARVVLASGTYEPVLRAFAAAISPQVEFLGTPLVCAGGKASGELGGPVNVGTEKARRVREYLGGQPQRAYGDTYPDRNLLLMAHQPVAVYPDPALRRLALRNHWRILEAAGGVEK